MQSQQHVMQQQQHMMQQQHIKQEKIKPKKRKQKHNQTPTYHNLTPFKASQKAYKLYQHKQTDFSDVYQPPQYLNVGGFQVAELPFPKGAYLVKHFNTKQQVTNIGLQALNKYCLKPYRTNIDDPGELYKEQSNQEKQQQPSHQQQRQQKQQQLKQIKQKQKQKEYYFNDRIRWANIGYQYDWTNRKYPSTKTPVPSSIKQMTDRANNLFNQLLQQSRQYEPQSTIVNYYSEKDYMTGHLDDAQIDQISPIYSFSFGLSCIFLIGRQTKEHKPIAVRLDSGDLFIMSGQSRLCYHGVPRIIKGTYNQQTPKGEQKLEGVQTIQGKQTIQGQQGLQGENSKKNVSDYFSHHRININIRQVYPK